MSNEMMNFEDQVTAGAQMAMGLLNGTIDVKVAAEVNNTFGKMINVHKTAIMCAMAKENLAGFTIPYLECRDSKSKIDITPKSKQLKQGT